MPKINVKLFASLGAYLPEGAKKNQVAIKCDDDKTVASILSGLNVPAEHCHLVFLNGVFVAPEARGNQHVVDDDTLAVWPPVAGG